MLRHTHLMLLALIALATTTWAQEPIYGLLPHESDITSEVMPAETATTPAQEVSAPVDAYPMPGQFAEPIGGSYGGDIGAGIGGCASCGGGGLDVGYGGGCDTCFSDCCGGCFTSWQVRSKSVFMTRESNDNTALVFQNVGLATFRQLLNAAQFDYDWEAGFDISLAQKDMYGGGVELRLFHLNDFDETIQGTGNLVELNSRFVPPIGLNPRTNPVNVVANYESELNTAELMYRESFRPWWHVGVGFRYVSLEETLGIFTADSAAPALQSATTYFTDNDLYGFQISTDYILASNSAGWEIIGTARVGIYYNDLKTTVQSAGDGFVNGRGYNRTGQTSFLGELGINAVYHVNCNTSFTFGYQLLSLDGVGLATEQMTSVANPLDGPDLIVGHNQGTTFYHGANAGIEIRW